MAASIKGFRTMRALDLAQLLVVRALDKTAPSSRFFQARNNIDLGFGRLFGGQPMAQALAAASATVGPDKLAHSFSCAFVREGDLDTLPEFQVDQVRDGRSFATRRVRAFQGHGDILDMLVSFHVHEPGLDHQVRSLPTDDDPEDLGPNEPRFKRFADDLGKPLEHVFPKPLADILIGDTQPMLIRPSVLIDVLTYDRELPPQQRNWIRAQPDFDASQVGFDQDAAELTPEQLNQVMLAFTSDFSFLGTSLLPHGTSVWKPTTQAASLTHTMFFHRPIDLQDWIAFDMESPIAAGARGFARGEMFDRRTGKLIASLSQEGLIRQRAPRSKPKRSQFS